MMALPAIALAISGLTFVGLSLEMGVVLVSVAIGCFTSTMLGVSAIAITGAGLYALIGLVASGFTWLAVATYAKIDRLPGIEHAGRFGHDNVDTYRNRPSSATVTHIRKYHASGALAT